MTGAGRVSDLLSTPLGVGPRVEQIGEVPADDLYAGGVGDREQRLERRLAVEALLG